MCGDVERGRQLVREGRYDSEKMVDFVDVLAYVRQQREIVGWRGECGGGCDGVGLVQHHVTGQAVCPRTYQPCERRRLSLLVDLYGSL